MKNLVKFLAASALSWTAVVSLLNRGLTTLDAAAASNPQVFVLGIGLTATIVVAGWVGLGFYSTFLWSKVFLCK